MRAACSSTSSAEGQPAGAFQSSTTEGGRDWVLATRALKRITSALAVAIVPKPTPPHLHNRNIYRAECGTPGRYRSRPIGSGAHELISRRLEAIRSAEKKF